MPPRRRSKLAGGGYGEPDPSTDQHDDRPEPPEPPAEPAGPVPDNQPAGETPARPITRNPRRLRVVGKVTDEDLVSFNCKMSRGLRREVRHFAADAECDIQDVVAAALAEYLVARGRAVPASELRQPG